MNPDSISIIYDFVKTHYSVVINDPIVFNIENNKKINNCYVKIKLPDISHSSYNYVDCIGKYILKTTQIKLYVDNHLLDNYVITNEEYYHYFEQYVDNNKETILFIKLLYSDHFSYINTDTEVFIGNFKFEILLELPNITGMIIANTTENENDELINYIKNN